MKSAEQWAAEAMRLRSQNVELITALEGLVNRLDSHFGGPDRSQDWKEQELARAAIKAATEA